MAHALNKDINQDGGNQLHTENIPLTNKYMRLGDATYCVNCPILGYDEFYDTYRCGLNYETIEVELPIISKRCTGLVHVSFDCELRKIETKNDIYRPRVICVEIREEDRESDDC